MEASELKAVLERHGKYLRDEEGGECANLSRADLSGANLSGANLFGANLPRANLFGANLSAASLPAPPVMLLAQWGRVSKALCASLMRYDSINHPDGPAAFDKWVSTGACPFANVRVQRAANFIESPDLWDTALPVLSAFELMRLVIREKCAASDYHDAPAADV